MFHVCVLASGMLVSIHSVGAANRPHSRNSCHVLCPGIAQAHYNQTPDCLHFAEEPRGGAAREAGAQSQAAHELRDRALVYAICLEDRLIWGSHP